MRREDLYALVWSTPITKAARQIGVSDVALAKACKAANIPVPPRGHWARQEAGKPTVRPTLPPRGPAQPDDIEIGATRWRYPSPLTDEELAGPPPPPPEFPEPVEQVREHVRALIGRVTVPRDGKRTHALIQKLTDADERRRAERATTNSEPLPGPTLQRPGRHAASPHCECHLPGDRTRGR